MSYYFTTKKDKNSYYPCAIELIDKNKNEFGNIVYLNKKKEKDEDDENESKEDFDIQINYNDYDKEIKELGFKYKEKQRIMSIIEKYLNKNINPKMMYDDDERINELYKIVFQNEKKRNDNSLKMKKKLIPIPKILENKLWSNTVLIYGTSGSGKSKIVQRMVNAYEHIYKQIHKKKKLTKYLITKKDNDPMINKIKELNTIPIETYFTDNEPSYTDFEDNSIIIADDFETYKISNIKIYNKIMSLLADIAKMGRCKGLNLYLIIHEYGREYKAFYDEAQSYLIYPSTTSPQSLKYICENKLGMTKKQIEAIKHKKMIYLFKNRPKLQIVDKTIELL